MKNTNKYEPADQSHVFTSFPIAHNDEEDMQKLLENTDDQQLMGIGADDKDVFSEEKTYSFWQIEFYQKYFNVNTNDVLARILGSMTPTFNSGFFLNKIRPNPDLYGPFWISITLIFTIAIAGNIVSFLRNFGSQYVWQTDFHKVTSSAACIITYWWLLPTVLYIMMRWRENRADYKFLEVLCIYGYSLSIYIPLSILWLINIEILQWTFTGAAILLSGSVLILNIWPAFSHDSNKKITYAIMAMIIVSHALLGIGFMLYFFHYPNESNPSQATTTTSISSNNTNFHKIRKNAEDYLVNAINETTAFANTPLATKSDSFN